MLHQARLDEGLVLERPIEIHAEFRLERLLGHRDRLAWTARATVPFSAAMTGRRQRRMFRMRSQVMSVKRRSPAASSEKSAPMMSSTSPPEQNALPAPVSTTARTPES